MISLTLSQILLLLMVPGLLAIALWWLVNVVKDRRRDHILRQSTLRCRICGCAYPSQGRAGEISRCPACASANIQEDQRII